MIETITNVLNDWIVNYGLIGFFFAALIANASLFLPLPIDIIVLGYSAFLDSLFSVIVLGLVVGLGAGIGEMSGYILGYIGHKSLEKLSKKQEALFYKAGAEIEKGGFLFVIIAAFTPIPFDAVGLAAGFFRYPFHLFFIGALIGKIMRYLLIALIGYYGMQGLGFIVGL